MWDNLKTMAAINGLQPLYERAQKHVPFFLYAEVHLPKGVSRKYDGIWISKEKVDPYAPCEEVMKVDYYVMRCIKPVMVGGICSKMPLSFEEGLQTVQKVDLKHYEDLKIPLTALNYHAAENPNQLVRIKNAQLLMGKKTRNLIERLCWYLSCGSAEVQQEIRELASLLKYSASKPS